MRHGTEQAGPVPSHMCMHIPCIACGVLLPKAEPPFPPAIGMAVAPLVIEMEMRPAPFWAMLRPRLLGTGAVKDSLGAEATGEPGADWSGVGLLPMRPFFPIQAWSWQAGKCSGCQGLLRR